VTVSNTATDLEFQVNGSGLSGKTQFFLAPAGVATGYKYNWSTGGIGYLVENNQIYSYSGKGSNWSWRSVMTVPMTKTSSQVTITVPLALMGVGHGQTIGWGFIAADSNSRAYPSVTQPLAGYQVP
jgi:hypothetical protein